MRGQVLAVALDHAVIEVGGVGLAVRTTPATLAGLRRGEQARLSTSLVVREDSLTLFGFATDEAKELFELVQSVSGVGPKIALALLAVLDPDELRTALGAGDTATLTRAPGIGKKGAERLVLELKDKVGALPGAGRRAAAPASASACRGGTSCPRRWSGSASPPSRPTRPTSAVAADTDDPAVADGDVGVLLRRALALLGRNR